LDSNADKKWEQKMKRSEKKKPFWSKLAFLGLYDGNAPNLAFEFVHWKSWRGMYRETKQVYPFISNGNV